MEADEAVLVRAHMNVGGYGGEGLKGSVAEGFGEEAGVGALYPELGSLQPQPDGCAF